MFIKTFHFLHNVLCGEIQGEIFSPLKKETNISPNIFAHHNAIAQCSKGEGDKIIVSKIIF